MSFLDDTINAWKGDVTLAPGSTAQNVLGNAGFAPQTSGTFGTGSYQGANQGVLSPQAQQAMLAQLQSSAGPGVAGLASTMAGYQGLANGTGPNLGQQQAQIAGQQNEQQALGLLSSQRGLNPGMAAKMAANNLASTGAQTTSAAATAGLQGQMTGLQGMGQTAGQQVQNSQFNAGQYNALLTQLQSQNAQLQGQQNSTIGQQYLQGQGALSKGITSAVGAASGAASGAAGMLA